MGAHLYCYPEWVVRTPWFLFGIVANGLFGHLVFLFGIILCCALSDEDILVTLRGYRRDPARTSFQPCEDILAEQPAAPYGQPPPLMV